jgi:5-methylcytosine-specific restriction endonuclease McrA
MARPQTDDYPEHLERIVEALVSRQFDAAAEAMRAIREPVRDVPRRAQLAEGLVASTYKRDRFHCRYCGCRVIPTQIMRLVSLFFQEDFPYHPNWKAGKTHPAIVARSATIDHKQPLAGNGTNDPDNLVCACWVCNRIKGDLSLEQIRWEVMPISGDSDWDGLTRYYRALWELKSCPSEGGHARWVPLYE